MSGYVNTGMFRAINNRPIINPMPGFAPMSFVKTNSVALGGGSFVQAAGSRVPGGGSQGGLSIVSSSKTSHGWAPGSRSVAGLAAAASAAAVFGLGRAVAADDTDWAGEYEKATEKSAAIDQEIYDAFGRMDQTLGEMRGTIQEAESVAEHAADTATQMWIEITIGGGVLIALFTVALLSLLENRKSS